MSEKPKIAIIASEKSRTDQGDRQFLDIRKMLDCYYDDVLKNYELVAPNETADLINRHLGAQLIVGDQRLGPNTYGVVRVGAMVAQKEKYKIERVLFFTEPGDLAIEQPVNYALLRNCNIFGNMLHTNESAWLWLRYAKEKKEPELSKDETVAYIAHDREKDRITWFVNDHAAQLKRFKRHIATARTGAVIKKRALERADLSLQFDIEHVGKEFKANHGPSGGDMIISDEIVKKAAEHGFPDRLTRVFHVLFFVDHHSSHPHMADIKVLLNVCSDPELRVNLILNSKMAEEWIQRYQPVI